MPRFIEHRTVAGFTLIELVITIVVLAILAVTALPKFLDLSDDAHRAELQATGAAFKEGISQANLFWQLEAGGQGPLNNAQVYGPGTDNRLDINTDGWPAQNYGPQESNPQLNNVNDCMSVWRTVTQNNDSSVSSTSNVDDSLYQAVYLGSNRCRFILKPLPALSISYDSRSGEVIIDDDYSS